MQPRGESRKQPLTHVSRGGEEATGRPGASERQGWPLAADTSASVVTPSDGVVRLGGGCQADAPARG